MPATHHDVSVRWETLGTYGFLAVDDPACLDAAHEIALDELAAVDRTCSRFRTDSDVSRANARPGEWTEVDPLLVAAVDVAVDAARLSDGLVDPCLGRSLLLLGYDADLAVVRERRTGPATVPAPPPPSGWREIRTDPDGALRVPTGCQIDLGATAKAWASDLVAASIVDRLGCHLVVSLGGDVRIGTPPGAAPRPWTVQVTERPADPDGELVTLDGGGLATSSTTARRWAHAEVRCTTSWTRAPGCRPTRDWRTVTATGPTCVSANIATTAALVLGPEAPAWLEGHGVTARLVDRDGSVRRIGHWPQAPATTTAKQSMGWN